MNNLKKVGLTALAGSLVAVSANAGEMSVTGAASIGFKQVNQITMVVTVFSQWVTSLLFWWW